MQAEEPTCCTDRLRGPCVLRPADHRCPRTAGGAGAGCRSGPRWSPFPGAPTPGSPAAHRFQEALSDFQQTLAQLRDNTAIDYTQLGLRFKLQAWEVSVRGAGHQEAV